MLTLISTGAAAYVLVCLGIFLLQDRLVYFPGERPASDPSALGLAFEERAPTASDGVRLHAWWIPAEDARGAVLVSHGNAGNVAGRLHLARAFHDMGLSALLYDYRGYGASEGRPSEEGTYLDSEAAYDLLAREFGLAPSEIALYGESLGGAVSVELARRRPAAALVLESTFTSLPDVGARVYPWLPVRLLARHRYDSAAKIGALELPILLVHSPKDEIVPFAHAERLLAAAGPGAELLRTAGTHNEGGFAARAEFRARVGEFLVESLERARSGAARPGD